ncbi:MAG: DUF3025 domain-containing protein, partial [Proteobacteria bacterium]|nr:DUF3025 domain-containing protein [Pseudomonadota bacterium]
MRFVAPARNAIEPTVFARPPLSLWSEYADLLRGVWPSIEQLNRRTRAATPRFIAQTSALLADGLHYEQRIFERGEIATREHNWHDLLNALVWLRYPKLKRALNARQVGEIARMGAKQRSRAQQALTHFDESGVIVALRDPVLLALWDAHDWHCLFWRERNAWSDGRIEVAVFGHALLEHALVPELMLTGAALAIRLPEQAGMDVALQYVADAIKSGAVLNDPQELRPLPLSGIPGWHAGNADANFYRLAECFRPL